MTVVPDFLKLVGIFTVLPFLHNGSEIFIHKSYFLRERSRGIVKKLHCKMINSSLVGISVLELVQQLCDFMIIQF